MILEKVNSPADLKKLNIEELKLLSQEIRSLIIEVVSRNGGHLASSLGAVELCIALHYCLNAPSDTIIFDVGHQSYAHKILTGRKDKFFTLRTYQGITGFPSPLESVYDEFFCGHASTAISWAEGIAEAKKIKKDRSKTVAVIGDGSLTGGLCFEALNHCGHLQTDLLIILNHNEMSISKSVGALSNYLTKIISAPIYNRIKKELENFIKHFYLIKRFVSKVKKFEEAIKGIVVPGIFFEELGFRYFGPIDGHNLEVLISTLKNLLSLKGPRVLHIITKKGKGYKLAEENPEKFHSVCTLLENGKTNKKTEESFSEVFAKKLVSIAKNNEKIIAITAAMPEGTGLNIFRENFPERFFDVGIAEEHAVSFASGLAKKRLKPVVAIYSTFLQRAFDQLIHDVGLQNLGIVFAIDRAGLVGEDGPTHQGIFDISYLRIIPNFICMAPKDKQELEEMLELALNLNSPVSIRYPKGTAYSLGKNEKVKLGKAQILCEGEDLCIVALGSTVKLAIECAKLLKKENISPFIVNARFIKPLDEELYIYLGNKFKLIISLEEGIYSGGFGSALLEFYETNELLEKVKIVRVALPDIFIPQGKREELFKIYGLDVFFLKEKIIKLLKNELLWQK